MPFTHITTTKYRIRKGGYNILFETSIKIEPENQMSRLIDDYTMDEQIQLLREYMNEVTIENVSLLK